MASRPIRILFADLHRPGRSPSQRFRYEQYVDYLQTQGFEVHHHYLLSPAQDKVYYAPGNIVGKAAILLDSIGKRLRDVWQAGQYDIVFVQREAFMLGTSLFERWLKRSGAKLVFDFDDSIWLQSVSEGNRALAFLKNPNKTAELIHAADLVFAGNAYLADYARQHNPRTIIVPTTLDTADYQPRPTHTATPANGPVIIGWSGSPTTTPHFELAIPSLCRIQERYGNGVQIKVVGDGNWRNEPLGIQGKAWRLQDEIPDVQSFDIGIMPLPDDQWTRGKCGFKGLLYMALGVPALMSPVGVNTDIIQDGVNGYLPAAEDEWVARLSELIENPARRQQLADAGRQTVVERYSKQAWQDVYVRELRNLVQPVATGAPLHAV